MARARPDWLKRLRDWWQGEWKVDGGKGLVIAYRHRSPWVTRIERIAIWCHRNAWNLFFATIGIAALWLGWLAV